MKKKWICMIATVLLTALIGVACSSGGDDYVAKVGSEKVTNTEYTFFLKLVKFQMENDANLVSADENAKKAFWTSKISGEDAESIAKNKALEKVKEFKIELLKAKENKITLTKEDQEKVDSYFKMFEENYGGKDKADEEVKKQLGISFEEYKAIQMDLGLIERFKSSQQETIQVNDDEIKKYYEENKGDVDKVTVRHILISTNDEENKPLPEDKQKEALKKANDILAKVNAGEDMKALAKEHSQDPGVTQNEGEYVFAQNEGYAPEFKEWAFKAKVGDTGIVTTTFGYHIMKLEKKTTFEDVKDEVKKQVQAKKYLDEFEKWKKDSKYDIEKNQKVIDTFKII